MQEIKDWITDLENLQEDVRDIATDMRSMKTGMNKYLLKSGERKQVDANKDVENLRTIVDATATKHGYMDVWRAVRKTKCGLSISALDQTYWAVPFPVWKKIIEQTKVDEYRYVSERADCEDFSGLFKGLSAMLYHVNGCGVVVDLGGRHAYIALLCNDGGKLSVKWLEPQTDEIVELKPGTAYTGTKGRIHF